MNNYDRGTQRLVVSLITALAVVGVAAVVFLHESRAAGPAILPEPMGSVYPTLEACKEALKKEKCVNGCDRCGQVVHTSCCKAHNGWILCNPSNCSCPSGCLAGDDPAVPIGISFESESAQALDNCGGTCYECMEPSCERGECKKWSPDGRCLDWHCRACCRRAANKCCSQGGSKDIRVCKNQLCPRATCP